MAPRPIRIGDTLAKPRDCRVVRTAADGTVTATGFGTSTFDVTELPSLVGGRWSVHGIFLDMNAVEHADGTAVELPNAPTSGTWVEERPCPVCGDKVARSRKVAGMRGHEFCGIVCHDLWDRIFRGVDRREIAQALTPADKIAALLRELNDEKQGAVLRFVKHVIADRGEQ